MKGPFHNIHLTNRLFWISGVIAVLFAVSFMLPWLYNIAIGVILLTVVFVLVDLILLFATGNGFAVERKMGNALSLSDENHIHIYITSQQQIACKLSVIDELPYQLQKRDFLVKLSILPKEKKQIDYNIRPLIRGEYVFNNINLYCTSVIGILSRRYVYHQPTHVPVYPSLIQMKEYELKTMSQISFFDGVKKLRRIGHSYEFDQIKKYVRGDDIRSINWKATSRVGEIMVNHYEDERSQQIFCIIDKSRTMKMPFNGLSLLDYAINTTLTISNIALKKEDRVGLISFSDKIGTVLPADKHHVQLRKVLESLYNEKERFTEANFELLYLQIRNFIKVRSLIFLFTNFESLYAIERAVSILRKLNKLHLLVVIFFENEEISEYATTNASNLEEVYLTTVAHKFAVEKNQIRQELAKYGIQTIISPPKELSINTINKYLEIKSRGII
jgi:uncharacterized protein (DUF58 family)